MVVSGFAPRFATNLRAQTTPDAGARAITTVPTTLSAPGTYFLGRDFATTLTGGPATFIAADDVTVDLNGHTLRTAAGPDNLAYAVPALNHESFGPFDKRSPRWVCASSTGF